MKYMGTICALLMLLCLCFAPALSVAEYEAYEEISDVTIPDMAVRDDVLLWQYIDRQFAVQKDAQPRGTLAYEELSADERALYDALKPGIVEIAAGRRASATFDAVRTAVYTAQDLGVDSILLRDEDGNYVLDGGYAVLNPAAREAAHAAFYAQLDARKTLTALLHDCPYELYWFHKSSGMKTYTSFRAGLDTLTVSLKTAFTVGMPYRGTDAYTADTEKTGAATVAAANARAIVQKYSHLSDLQKLAAYRDEICALADYDHSAANAQGYSAIDGNPWQLIYVFDGDDATRVVCEGYAKAFQYLCDMSSFEGDVRCFSVTGTLGSIAGESLHMWNIVSLGEGKNYLVDLTNSDAGEDGSRDGLFIDPPVFGGSVQSGYRFDCGEYGEFSYAYDDETKALWGTGENSILNLSLIPLLLPGDALPRTGDGSNLALWAAVCAICVGGLAVLRIRKKR